MILEDLVALTRRQQIPIRDDERETLERDGPRALNYMMARGLRQMRLRFMRLLLTLLFLLFAHFALRWSGAGLLAFVLYGAALTVAVDVMRQLLAARWLFYSHSRAYRAQEALIVGRSVESGSTLRPPPRPRPQAVDTLMIAAVVSAIGIPLLAFGLNKLGWVTRDTIFANRLLPLSMLALGGWQLLRGLQGIRFVRQSTVGSRDLFVDSDDALDTYALIFLLTLLLAAFGQGALAWVGILAVGIRLLWLTDAWRRQRRDVGLLQRHVYRIHPHAPGALPQTDGDDALDDSV